MKRWLILLIVFLLVACNGNGGQEEQASLPTEAVAVAQPTIANPEPAAPTATQLPAPAGITPPATTSAATEAPAGDPTNAPTESAMPPTEAPIINGQNPDGTFFRGWSTASVTITDYSDFL